MRIRFWQIWTLAAGFLTASAFGQAPQPTKAKAVEKAGDVGKTPEPPKAVESSGRTVKLEVAVASGLGAEGGRIEIKPANATCRFTTQVIEIPAGSSGTIKKMVTLKDVEIRGADRNLSVAITIRKGDDKAKTIYRGYRVSADPKPGQVEQFSCWMSAPSRSAAAIAATPADAPAPARR